MDKGITQTGMEYGAIAPIGLLASARQGEHRWISDPLDGTTDFAHGFPRFCSSARIA
jgi:myo-inositol-1(or 4)-monophosphatase